MLSANDINFTYVDITENTGNLRMYLKFRDTRPEFEEVKKRGAIGIPFIMIGKGDKFIFDDHPNLEELREFSE